MNTPEISQNPNAETLEAIKECEEGRGIKCDSIEDFWKKMGVKPSAKITTIDLNDKGQ